MENPILWEDLNYWLPSRKKFFFVLVEPKAFFLSEIFYASTSVTKWSNCPHLEQDRVNKPLYFIESSL